MISPLSAVPSDKVVGHTTVIRVSASSPEGMRLLADSLETGEPGWKAEAYRALQRNGAQKSPPPPLDVKRYIASLSEKAVEGDILPADPERPPGGPSAGGKRLA